MLFRSLPNFIAGELREDDLYFVEDSFKQQPRLNIINGEAFEIDSERKTVKVEGHKDIKFDKLIFTTGASPSKSEIEDRDIQGIYNLRDFEDALNIKRTAENTASCVVVGGGLVSLKAAWALSEIKKTVTLVVSSNQLLSTAMDIKGAKIIRKLFEQIGRAHV